ncbi:hypothetical protein [Alteribacillus bidgolensis]|uniref:Uncharacterized protein n=1 Tax=Alteribacillus bidgolensis TaxID=930129 RepID=A0A1G8S4G3_9BACI|nr:hypothetical protein [Alteribacillus bidgolensis]SDJ23550.1 hypothetical protein SAMN05216352_1405 [Alteribacillus bidgolensis]
MDEEKRFSNKNQKKHEANIYKVNYTYKGKREYKVFKAESAGQAEENMFSLNKKVRNIHAEIIDGKKEI